MTHWQVAANSTFIFPGQSRIPPQSANLTASWSMSECTKAFDLYTNFCLTAGYKDLTYKDLSEDTLLQDSTEGGRCWLHNELENERPKYWNGGRALVGIRRVDTQKTSYATFDQISPRCFTASS